MLKTGVLCCLVILWTAFIWSNSAKPAVESSGQSLQVLEWVKGTLLSMGFSADVLHVLVRKTAHVLECAVLGGLWSALTAHQWSRDRKFAWILAFALCLMTALTDETIQLCFEGRAGMIVDLWVDLGGIVLGMIATGICFALGKAKRR